MSPTNLLLLYLETNLSQSYVLEVLKNDVDSTLWSSKLIFKAWNSWVGLLSRIRPKERKIITLRDLLTNAEIRESWLFLYIYWPKLKFPDFFLFYKFSCLQLPCFSQTSSVHSKVPSCTGVAEIILRTQTQLSLKCLAAKAVQLYKIDYVGQVPQTLEGFVDWHGPGEQHCDEAW